MEGRSPLVMDGVFTVKYKKLFNPQTLWSPRKSQKNFTASPMHLRQSL